MKKSEIKENNSYSLSPAVIKALKEDAHKNYKSASKRMNEILAAHYNIKIK